MGNMSLLGPHSRRSLGYLALPDGGVGSAVLLLHAWWGLTPFFRAVCERLAGQGFVTLAPDLYHGATAATSEGAKQLRSGLDDEQANAEIQAAVKCLQRHPGVSGASVGVVGFSLGGYLALRLARHVGSAVAAVVVFYATEGGRFDTAQGAFLGHFAASDGCWAGPRAMHSLYERLWAAGCEAEFYVYPDTVHAFFEQDRPGAYHPQAAELAWRRTVAFLREHLTTPKGASIALQRRARACEWVAVGLA
jgi:carboxymethylenebutenolidase